MRGPLLVTLGLFMTILSGCTSANVPLEPPLSSTSASTSAAAPISNEWPTATFAILNESGQVSLRHYVGDNVTFDAAASSDPDGRIANYTWRMLRGGYFDPDMAAMHGPKLVLRMIEPGPRTIMLQVRDDQGATDVLYESFSVNQHRIESGMLLGSQLVASLGPLGDRNISLPVKPGALALSIQATFPEDPAAKLRLEIRAPNGTVLNRSEATKGPLWAVAAPSPGVYGNYTAHIGLATGVAQEFRAEFIVWYGYT